MTCYEVARLPVGATITQAIGNRIDYTTSNGGGIVEIDLPNRRSIHSTFASAEITAHIEPPRRP